MKITVCRLAQDGTIEFFSRNPKDQITDEFHAAFDAPSTDAGNQVAEYITARHGDGWQVVAANAEAEIYSHFASLKKTEQAA